MGTERGNDGSDMRLEGEMRNALHNFGAGAYGRSRNVCDGSHEPSDSVVRLQFHIINPGPRTGNFPQNFDTYLFVVLLHKPTIYKWIPSVHAGIAVQVICPMFWLAGHAVWSARLTNFGRLIVPSYSCPRLCMFEYFNV
jgi:hypothetical protein